MPQLQDLIDGYQATCILVAAERIGVFDALSHGPRSVAALVESLAVDENNFLRLVRVLQSYRLLSIDGGELQLTTEGRGLSFHASSVSDRLRLISEEYLAVWSQLDVSVERGQPVYETIFGDTPWRHRQQNPRICDAFVRMTETPQLAAATAIMRAYDFSPYPRIGDIGGGRGYLLSSILEGHPELRGVLFDLPHVAKSAGERLATLRIANRCEVEGGSFFERVPENLDVYILQYVLHDWDDERCRTILAACRAAMRTGSRLLIVEKPLPEGPDLGDLHWLGLRDIHMMLVHGGRERTLEQYDALLDSASFRRTSHRRLDAHLPDVIEALPA